MNAIQSHVFNYLEQRFSFTPDRAVKVVKVALATLFALGAVIAFSLGAPWFYPFIFFSLALGSLFRVGRAVDEQRERIIR